MIESALWIWAFLFLAGCAIAAVAAIVAIIRSVRGALYVKRALAPGAGIALPGKPAWKTLLAAIAVIAAAMGIIAAVGSLVSR